MDWNSRNVRVVDGLLQMSARNNALDFDYMRNGGGFQAMAGNPGSRVLEIEKIDEKRLKIVASGGDYLLVDRGIDSNIDDFAMECA